MATDLRGCEQFAHVLHQTSMVLVAKTKSGLLSQRQQAQKGQRGGGEIRLSDSELRVPTAPQKQKE